MNDFFSQPSDRRRNHRLAIHHHAQLRLTLDGTEPGEEVICGVTLTDISNEGLMAADAGQLVPGARIVLEIPLVGWREADVVWIADNRAGCRFLVPLSLEELRLAAASSNRLSEICPAFASQIADIAVTEQPIAARVAAPRTSLWKGPVLALLSLGIASFFLTSWLIARAG